MRLIRDKLKSCPAPDALLFDLDGTLYRGNERIPGAGRLITDLQQRGMACWFVTNNSTRTAIEVAEHLHAMGIPAEKEKIVTSALAAAYYVREHYQGSRTFVIGERGLQEALRGEGIQLLTGETEDRITAELVVQGLDRNLTYESIRLAVKHLLGGAVFVQTNPDRLLPVDRGFLPGAGSIGAALQAASGIEPIVIGKPSKIMMDYTLKLAGVTPARAWVIGDNPYTDLAAGRNAGCPSILVLTGLCTADNWQEHCQAAGVEPHAVCDGPDEFAAILDEWNTK
ncbi:HAD-IIA family hydrolase [Cohnella sp.]|uniref:HAD-IIA family hydrolase n=1 Tax=Cohnella sp. TaxID=1883426 RepID=UPI00356A99D5